MKCRECPDYNVCSKLYNLRNRRRSCAKAKLPGPYPDGHCPYCGSTAGVFSKVTVQQFYTFQGEPDGVSEDGQETDSIFCRDCNMLVGKRSLLFRGVENE